MSCACPQAAHSQAAALARRRACASHALPLPFAGEARQRRAGVASAAADDGGGVLAFLKGVQAGLPVIGLVSRLAAPGGGVEAGKLGYQEYTRACFERDTEESRAFGFAVAELSRTRKLNSRIMFVCWAVAQGAGVVAEDVIKLACVRLSTKSSDLEYEIFRFEEALDAALKRRARLSPPPPLPPREARCALAAACLRSLLRLKEGEVLGAEEEGYVSAIASGW